MRDILRLIGALTIISGVAGLLLAVTNNVTRGPITVAAQKEMDRSLCVVLPPFTNTPSTDCVTIPVNNKPWVFYIARSNNVVSGVAVVSESSRGYGGVIRVLIGLQTSGEIYGVRILEQHETPGLGTKIEEWNFLRQFIGRGASGTQWAVTKDQGDIDAITGATISSRAVIETIRNALEVFSQNKGVLSGISAQEGQ